MIEIAKDSLSDFIVIKVLTEEKIVINKGRNDGVKVGQKFLIYGIGEELFDPVSGKSLGVLEMVRGQGRVSHVQDNQAQIRSIEQTTKKTRDMTGILSAYMLSPTVSESYVDEPFEGVVKGDLARPI
jgi:hypothetical protein